MPYSGEVHSAIGAIAAAFLVADEKEFCPRGEFSRMRKMNRHSLGMAAITLLGICANTASAQQFENWASEAPVAPVEVSTPEQAEHAVSEEPLQNPVVPVEYSTVQPMENWISEAPAGRGYFAHVEALWLKRDASDAATLATLNSPGHPGRPQVLASENVDFDFETGIRAIAGMMLNDCTQLEIEYLGIDQFDGDEATLVRPPGPFALNSVFTVLNQTPSIYQADGETALHSGELNLRRRGGFGRISTSALVGFRYLNIRDSLKLDVAAFRPIAPNPLAITLAPPLATESTSADTRNNIFGLQLGGDVGFHWDYVHITAAAEGFVYGNFYDTDARNVVVDPSGFFLAQSGGGTFRNSTANDDKATAGIGAQCGLDVALCLSNNIILHGGYNVLALSDVALGSEQLPPVRTSPARGARIFNPDRAEELGSLFFHGPSAGLEFRW
jgi:hypothetical protein